MTESSIIDSHVHLWDPVRFDYDWLAGTPLERRFDADDLYAAGGAGVSSFVIVQADCAPDQGLAEVEWLIDQMDSQRRLGGIVAFAPVELGRDVEPLYQRLRSMPQVVGIRRLLQDEPRGYALQPGFLTGLELLRDVGLPFDVCVRADQLADVIDVVRRVPEVRFVLDHLGKPVVGTASGEWRKALAALAEQPNVVCKLSGLTTETADTAWSSELIHPYLAHALDVFGPARCLFASDWPVLTTAATPQRWLDAVVDALAGFTTAEIEQVMAGNARAIYGVDQRALKEEIL